MELDANLLIETNGWLSHPVTNALNLKVTGDVTVEAGGYIAVGARGYAAQEGPGWSFSGGGYGGRGGGDGFGNPGGGTYGSLTEPVDFGSGGIRDTSRRVRAGGALRLWVGGELRVNGKIVADGQPAAGGGGPSGGSLWLTARKLTGVGLISADGGSATGLMRGNYGESGGGGGRIAIYTTCPINLGSLVVRVNGGTGFEAGRVGSIYYGVQKYDRLGLIASEGAVAPIAPPASVELNRLTNNLAMFFFTESTNLALPTSLAVEITVPGRYDSFASLTNSRGTIPKSTPVSSHFVHLDTSYVLDADPDTMLTNRLTFDSPILGIILTPSLLNASDLILGSPETVYPTSDDNYWRGLEMDDNADADADADWITLGQDRKTITISSRVREWADQVRIITSAYGECQD